MLKPDLYPRRLDRLFRLIILLLVAATALLHPLCLPEDTLERAYTWLANPTAFAQIRPWIDCGFSPLVLKEAALLSLSLLGLFVFTWMKIRGQLLGTERSALGRWTARELLQRPQVWAGLWLIYSAVTILWKSPTFEQSLASWITMAAGLIAGLMMLSLPASRAYVRNFLFVVVACGALIAVAALLQHLDKARWLPQFDDPRNRMSSLIGHNTGMSSWLMFPLSYCVYFALGNRWRWARTAAWLLVALFSVVIVAAESRAIWVLGLVLLLFLPWKIGAALGRRLRWKGIAAAATAAVAVVLALSLSPGKNPLARLPVSLSERVTGHIFNADQLRRETRLRILVVSAAELLPAAPLTGSGFGTFAWVYPKAQGEYFQSHPDSRLGTTTKRTDLAHNDYLQILVETGLVGLGLGLAGGWFFLRKVWRAKTRLAAPHDRALWWALTAPAFCVMTQAFVDFPFHVAPIAVLTLFSLILSLKIQPGSESAEASDGMVADVPRAAATAVQWTPHRATAAGFVVCVVLFSWVPWFWSAAAGKQMVSDIYFNAGRTQLAQFYQSKGQTLQAKFTLLERARQQFRQAVVTNVFNGEAYEGQATAYVNRAALAMQALQQKGDAMPTTKSLSLKLMAQRDSRSAESVINNQLASGGLRYHFTYYLLGRACRILWELEKDEVAPADSVAYTSSVLALKTAVGFNPADAVALREYADVLSENPKTAAAGLQVLTRLFKIDPHSARELLVLPAVELAAEGEVATAKAMLDPIIAQYPKEPAVLWGQAWVAYFDAVWPPEALDDVARAEEYRAWRREHLEPARAALEALPEAQPYGADKQRLTMLFAAAAGDLAEAHAAAKARLAAWPQDGEALAVYNWTQQKLYGGGMVSSTNTNYLRASAELAANFMDPREQSLLWTVQVYAHGDRLTLGQARRVARLCVANGWWEALRKGLPGILKDYPGDPILRDIAVKADVGVSAGDAF